MVEKLQHLKCARSLQRFGSGKKEAALMTKIPKCCAIHDTVRKIHEKTWLSLFIAEIGLRHAAKFKFGTFSTVFWFTIYNKSNKVNHRPLTKVL